MASAEHLKALLRSRLEGGNDRFISVAMQVAAHELKATSRRLGERRAQSAPDPRMTNGTGGRNRRFLTEGVTETEAYGYPDGPVFSAVRTGPARESVSRDAGVRPALRRYLDQRALDYPETVLIEELGLCQGRARIDLATVGGVLHGYEIKSNGDRLSRLASQAETSGRVFDRVTFVVGAQHVRAALRLVPRWWGVLRVRGGRGSLA